jgi:hypothetical protein
LKAQLVALEAVSARHSAHVTIMWQAPGPALAAEAFLLTIAPAPDSSVAARIVASIVGLLVILTVSILHPSIFTGPSACSWSRATGPGPPLDGSGPVGRL